MTIFRLSKHFCLNVWKKGRNILDGKKKKKKRTRSCTPCSEIFLVVPEKLSPGSEVDRVKALFQAVLPNKSIDYITSSCHATPVIRRLCHGD